MEKAYENLLPKKVFKEKLKELNEALKPAWRASINVNDTALQIIEKLKPPDPWIRVRPVQKKGLEIGSLFRSRDLFLLPGTLAHQQIDPLRGQQNSALDYRSDSERALESPRLRTLLRSDLCSSTRLGT